MSTPRGSRELLATHATSLTATDFLADHGEPFAVFDERTQDSGNVSYGMRAGNRAFFIKTAGQHESPRSFLSRNDRIALLRNAVDIAQSVVHPTLPALRNVIEASDGPLLVYDWVDGELLGGSAEERAESTSAHQRFRGLSIEEIAAALSQLIDLHVELARSLWIVGDFYDGCLMYDFAARTMRVVDLDQYHRGVYVNTMGRMFGSTRFMAPEEFELGATIDERTTVFNLGRAVQQFVVREGTWSLHEQTVRNALLDAAAKACATSPAQRYQSVQKLAEAWHDATTTSR